jgi:uracil-DNA glycosylase
MPSRKAVLSTAAALIPDDASLPRIREIAAGCQACDLWQRGTQTVFGEGKARSRIMLVGEQPGNDEDLAGHPFVGPSGRLLDSSLEEAGIDRELAYVTNVVKHFKWEPRGKRRIHAKPNAQEITACLPWLQAEIRLVRPDVVVCLGATAAQALLGRTFRVTKQRGMLLDAPFGKTMATVHPSSILRAPDDEARRTEMSRFIADLKNAAEYLKQH